MVITQSNMISSGFLIYFLLSGLTVAETRKVLVREIRFSVASRDLPVNVSVKNGVDGGPNAQDTKPFQVPVNNGAETENKLIQEYNELIHEEAFNTGTQMFKEEIQNDESYQNKKDPHKDIKETPNKKKTIDPKNRKEHTDKDTVSKKGDGVANDVINDTYTVEENRPDSKIVGGSVSIPSTWSWQVSIQYFGEDNYWHHFCGGSLINSKWVITAAHCVCKLADYTIRVVLGDYRLTIQTHREQIIDPARILMHEYYEDTSYNFDIAMVKLTHRAAYTNYVDTIEMASPTMDTFDSSDICYITGWGNTIGSTEEAYMSDYLRQGQVYVITQSTCRQTYGNIIEHTQVCLTGENVSACSGDSGGPLVCAVDRDWVLAGIASWVGSATCSPEYPNVYTRMSTYKEWALTVMTQY